MTYQAIDINKKLDELTDWLQGPAAPAPAAPLFDLVVETPAGFGGCTLEVE